MYQEASAISSIQNLHEAFVRGKLKVLVGAGVSCAAGLPSWEELCLGILSSFLRLRYGSLDFQQADLEAAARVFVDGFGREAVVDVVRESLSSGSCQGQQFIDILRESLYREKDGPKEESEVHFELAGFLGRYDEQSPQQERVLYTFNFDNLLERAIERLLGEVAGSRYQGGSRHIKHAGAPIVEHLHGYLPLKEEPGGRLILSEKDYHATRDGSPVRRLKDLFLESHELTRGEETRPAVLLVGLSLTDPRLRSVLLERKEKLAQGLSEAGSLPEVYVLLYRPPSHADAPLTERLARSFVREHEERFWKDWGIHIITVSTSGLIPFILRQIRLGRDAATWMRYGWEFLSKQVTSLYTEKLLWSSMQAKILKSLKKACDFIQHRFAVATDEQLGLAGFVPRDPPDGLIQLGFRFSNGRVSPEPIHQGYVQDKVLRVGDLDNPQSVVGRAFIWGATTEASRYSPYQYKDLLPEQWDNERTYSSLLCVPVYDSNRWAPVGVCCLSSNQKLPFWSRMKARELKELEGVLRDVFSMALGYTSIWEGARTAGCLGSA